MKKGRGKMKFLVTGTAGFIGFHLAQRLLAEGHMVVGIDNLNPYYDVTMKHKRNDLLLKNKYYTFYKQDLSEFEKLNKIVANEKTDTPISLYGATKKANELLAYSYHHLYNIEVAGLRFFTVYGPYGRPDLALFKFCKNMLRNQNINVFNKGDMKRDFTYISDVVDGIMAFIFKKNLGYEIYNLGGDNPVRLMDFVRLIEENLNFKAKIKYLPIQPGDVKETCADVTKARKELGYDPKIKIENGVKIFCEWFLENKDWLLKLEEGEQ